MSRTCEYTDAVLAHFLDGDSDPIEIDASTWRHRCTADELSAHRRECPACARSLALARRLDALVATTAETEVDPADAARWFEAVERRTEPVDKVDRRRSRVRVAALAVACVVLGFALARLAGVRESTPRPAPPRVVVEPRAGSSTPEFVLPARRRAPMRARALVVDRSEVGEHPELDTLVRAAVRARAGALGIDRAALALEDDARAALQAVRVDSLQELVRRAQRTDVVARVARRLRAWPDSGLDEAVAVVRSAPRVVERLATAVPHGQRDDWIEAAALLGGAGIDERLARRFGADPDGANAVALVVARLETRPGRAELLVALWERLRVRGLVTDDLELAVRWFVPQPSGCTAELAAMLRRSRDAGARRLVLLALAARSDPAVSAALAAIVGGPSHDEAVLAAFALGRMPAGCDALSERPLKRDYLRRCALISRGDAVANAWLDRLRVTDEEREFLRAGRFTESQFWIAAALCRERQPDRAWSDD